MIYPQLRPGVEIIRIDTERVLLRSFSRTVMLSGEFVMSELPKALVQMDGNRTVAEITESISDGFRAEFEEFLALAVEKQLVGEASPATDGVLPDMSGQQKTFWSLYPNDPANAYERLHEATVLISSRGVIGSTVTLALAAAGVGKLIAVNPHPACSLHDLCEHAAADGRDQVDATYPSTATWRCTKYVPIAGTIDGLSEWEQLVSEADLVVVTSDNMSLAGYSVTNEACIRHRKRWVSARVDRTRGIIGPFVAPRESACFMCFELRARANAEHPMDHEALYRHWKNVDSVPDNWPINESFLRIVGNYLALDIQRVLTGVQVSAFLGRIFYLDLHTFESKFHELLKIPRCPACSRAIERPLSKIWDVRSAVDSHVSADRLS